MTTLCHLVVRNEENYFNIEPRTPKASNISIVNIDVAQSRMPSQSQERYKNNQVKNYEFKKAVGIYLCGILTLRRTFSLWRKSRIMVLVEFVGADLILISTLGQSPSVTVVMSSVDHLFPTVRNISL